MPDPSRAIVAGPRDPRPESNATRLADAIRRGDEQGGPSTVYAASVNREDYQHAMVHAGWVIHKSGATFVVCPHCGAHIHQGHGLHEW